MMSSMTLPTLLLAYFVISIILHPCLALPPPSPSDVPKADAKMIDQAIGYVLMLVALVVTYLIH
ncbi:Arabinogalactan protein 16/20/22/41 [Dioscorea alata]|uniref:Arabinogalactan protein 16/20/22/41 n=1 Tax=Dioscorea alata TaxID=55571 RepID=A0ACB7TU14_DIOAL|nr:Arabinogalactan protein 16/20/22/41 [Dioscorea alata]